MEINDSTSLDAVEITALWCSLDIMAHERRPIGEDARVLAKAARFIKEYQPVPVSESLPENMGTYLVYFRDKHTQLDGWGLSHFEDGDFWDVEAGDIFLDCPETNIITHWLPLPPKPE